MIVWTEQRPDFVRMPLDILLAKLDFSTACALVVGCDGLPKALIDTATMEGVRAHLRERHVEMGGLLLGTVYQGLRGGDDLIISVDGFVRSTDFDGTQVSLRMGTHVWERARTEAGPLRFVVGWYHSHPNLGVFFSGTDRRTQRAFFNHPHSLGLVIDPVRDEDKWFIGGDSCEMRMSQVIRFA
jgi:proteasome lid subunit RPN8/RPN11